jgi:hypothetical protein
MIHDQGLHGREYWSQFRRRNQSAVRSGTNAIPKAQPSMNSFSKRCAPHANHFFSNAFG